MNWYLEVLILLVPLISGIVLLVLMALDSESRQNRYDVNPKEGEKGSDVNQMHSDFNRRQLAWMGLALGAVLIVLLNLGDSYYSAVGEIAGVFFTYQDRGMGTWIINAILVVAIWFFRVALGAIFAFVAGVVINVLAFLFKRV